MRPYALSLLAVAAAALGAGCPAELGRCGDGALDPGEECDDGNQTAGDGCSPSCRSAGQDEDGDGVATPEDCNDRLASVHPGADEVPCDGVDNDCAEETRDCPAGGDAGLPDAGDPPDAELPPPDAEVPPPDACVPRAVTCADCIDDDCDGDDEPCDPAASVRIEPPAPAADADATVAVTADTGYAWVLLAHVSPDGATSWLPCQDCSTGGPPFTWSYTLRGLAQGRHVVRFERDHENDDPAVGEPVICASFDVGP